MSVPDMLIDPDGEGVYLLNDPDAEGYASSPGVLWRASHLLGVPWRELHHETVYMRPSPTGDEWLPADIGKHPYGWKLNLPKRWRPVAFAYCVPEADS